MKVDLHIPEMWVPISNSNLEKNLSKIDDLSKISPKKEHIERLIKIPPLGKAVDRRTIRVFFRQGASRITPWLPDPPTPIQIDGYRVEDWRKDDLFLGGRYFPIEDLES